VSPVDSLAERRSFFSSTIEGQPEEQLQFSSTTTKSIQGQPSKSHTALRGNNRGSAPSIGNAPNGRSGRGGSTGPQATRSSLLDLPYFSPGPLPSSLPEDFEEFNTAMHAAFGYCGGSSGAKPTRAVSAQFFRDFNSFHLSLPSVSQWQTQIWIDTLKPFVETDDSHSSLDSRPDTIVNQRSSTTTSVQSRNADVLNNTFSGSANSRILIIKLSFVSFNR
jgi:hypothetical protein